VAQEDSAARAERPVAAGAAAANGSAADRGKAELQASMRRFRQTFGRVPAGMVMTSLAPDRPGAYLAVSDTFCDLTGYAERELTGDLLSDVHPEQQPAIEAMIQDVISGATDRIRADTRLVRKDGGILSVHLTGSAIEPPAGERYLASFIDDATAAERGRAEIGRLEHELRQSRRLESLGQLVGGIAHDFNNLLAVIGNYASLVYDEVSAAEATDSATRWEPVRRDVEQIEAAADRATRLIKHLQAFARRQEARPVPVDLNRLVGDVTSLLGRILGEHVSLITRPGTGLWPVHADPGQLEQAVINIAVNARDAMPAGGQVIIGTANVGPAEAGAAEAGAAEAGVAEVRSAADGQRETGPADLLPGRYVRLSISDTGTGMDAVTASRAFEPFFTTRGDQAAGLGLSAVSRYVARAGGRAWLRSEQGTGTTVTLLLPAAPGPGPELPGMAGARPAAPKQDGTVLVVDDEAAIRDVAHRILTRAGYGAVTAAGWAEALGVVGNPATPIDLILTDVVMPGMTCEAFAAKVRRMHPGIQVLFMSGYEQPGPAPGGWPDPDAELLDKPFSGATLLARVRRLLAADPAGRG
jgi:PAS domain S-box-containing protein